MSTVIDPTGAQRDLQPSSEDGAPPGAGDAAPFSGAFRRPSVVFLVIVSGLAAAADLGTKWWAKATLSIPNLDGTQRRQLVFGDLFDRISFDMVFAQNPGGAFSMMRNLPEIVRRPFFLYVSAAATVFLVAMYLRVDRRHRALVWGLPLALGGAIGNLVDRVRYGWVIDFIHFWVRGSGREHHWPTFNVADVAIVIGVGLLAADLIFGKRGVVAAASTRS